jgi:hypothetical protein
LSSGEQVCRDRRDKRVEVTPSSAFLWVPSQAPIQVQVMDISRNGLRLATVLPLIAGSTVAVILGRLTIKGCVIYCKTIREQYAVGIRITNVHKIVGPGHLN